MTWTMATPGSARFRSRCVPISSRSQIWMVLSRSFRCWAMIAVASCLLVRRKVAIPGGTAPAMRRSVSSGTGPGPLGIAETKPRAEAPWRIAIQTSSVLDMQQILTRVLPAGFISLPGAP
jgi:hypothetical protein